MNEYVKWNLQTLINETVGTSTHTTHKYVSHDASSYNKKRLPLPNLEKWIDRNKISLTHPNN